MNEELKRNLGYASIAAGTTAVLWAVDGEIALSHDIAYGRQLRAIKHEISDHIKVWFTLSYHSFNETPGFAVRKSTHS